MMNIYLASADCKLFPTERTFCIPSHATGMRLEKLQSQFVPASADVLTIAMRFRYSKVVRNVPLFVGVSTTWGMTNFAARGQFPASGSFKKSCVRRVDTSMLPVEKSMVMSSLNTKFCPCTFSTRIAVMNMSTSRSIT